MNWNNKILAIVFFVLLGIWVLTNVVNRPSERSFKATLLQVDTATVDKLILHPKGIDSSYVQLDKKNGQWTVSDGQQSFAADKNVVNSLLSQIVYVPTKQLISKKQDKQKDYEVDEGKGKILAIYSGDQLLSKVIFGRFNFNQTTRAALSYARLDGDDDIYALDGMLSISFDKKLNDFRNNKLTELTPAAIKGLTYNNQPILLNSEGQWIYQDIQLDSLQMVNYLSGLKAISGTDFINNYTPTSSPQKQLKITIDNQFAPLELNCYKRGNESFAIQSSANDAFFASDSTGIYKKIFGTLEDILVENKVEE